MYTYTATGLDASMPAWVQDGGLEKWTLRLKDPAIRATVAAEMRDPHPAWDNGLHKGMNVACALRASRGVARGGS